MMSAALASAMRLFWCRDRKILLAFAVAYLALFLACQVFPPAQVFRYFPPAMAFMRLVPFFLPFALLFGVGQTATLRLSGREGHFPRFFFTLPLEAHEMVAPYIAYCVLMATVFWLAGILVTDWRILMLGAPGTPVEAETIAYWLPLLATSLLVWFQVIIWTPFNHGGVRVLVLLATIAAFCVVIALRAAGALTQAEIIVGSVLQIPLAVLIGARGVARDRSGGTDHGAATPTSAAKSAERRPLRTFISAMDAQLWFERQIHRWNGLFVFAVPVVLLAIFIALDLRGAATTSPQAFRAFAGITIFALVWILIAIAFALGIQSAAFRSASQWQRKEPLAMPSFFAALPLSTGDFLWTKLTAVTTRMLWIACSAALACAWVASRGGLLHTVGGQALALRHQYGDFTAGAVFVMPAIAFILLTLSGAADLMCLSMAGRAWNWLTIANCTRGILYGLGGAALGVYWGIHGMPPPGIPETLWTLAAVKVATLVVLVRYVRIRGLLSSSRVIAILGAWFATFAALLITALSFLPAGLISESTLIAVLILISPVQGTIAAPIALHLNRVR